MGILFLIIIILAVGFFLGYKVASWHIKRENETISFQNALLTRYSDYWSAASTNRYQLYGKVAQEQTGNVSQIINTVIQLLHTLQNSQTQNLNREDQKVIADIINQAKSISPRSEYE